MKTSGYLCLLGLVLTQIIISCNQKAQNDNKSTDMSTNIEGSFGYDVDFLSKHNIKTIQLKDSTSNAVILIAPGLQGRVLTSSCDGDKGMSYGWINHKFIDSAVINRQFNPFGGEERLWLGPEGGPFSIYFKKGTSQVFAHWKVPKELDTDTFEVVKQEKDRVEFRKTFTLENYSGTLMTIGLERAIHILNRNEIEKSLGLIIDTSIRMVAYQSDNVLINEGNNDWKRESGFLSVWLLSMFKPSQSGVVFIPFKQGPEKDLGLQVNDDYFGKVPADRLFVKDNRLFFKVDGKHRSKIGISPVRALSYCGSYDPDKGVLTILWYSKPGNTDDYVNSKWGKQTDPLKGDAVNSYNDGPVEDGSVMGPFYEIESSSPAAILKSGDRMQHNQRIYHFSGPEEHLNTIVLSVFGISLDEIKTTFTN